MSELQTPANLEALTTLLVNAEKNNTALVFGHWRLPAQAPTRSPAFVDLSGLNKVIDYSVADQVILVEAGMTVAELRRVLVANRQWWPVYAPPEWTIADVLNGGDSGALEHKFGPVRDLVLGLDVLTGGGKLLHCGGKVVKNVSGYDLTRLFVGAQGTLGIITSAWLRLYALPEYSTTLRWRFKSFKAAQSLSTRLINSGLPLSALTIYRQTNADHWLVYAQAQGLENVVAEVADSAASLESTTSASVAAERIEGLAGADLWSEMTEKICGIDEHIVRAIIPARSLAVLAEKLANLGALEIRPLSGRVTIVGCEAEPVQELCSRAAVESAPIVVAGADSRYNYQVRRYPPSDLAFVQLQERLKRQFDPANIFNPYAKL